MLELIANSTSEGSRKMEICENCGNTIGKLEQPCIFCDKIVCCECDEKLRRQIVESVPNINTAISDKNIDSNYDTALGIISFLIPLAGIIIGAVLVSKPNKKDKDAGTWYIVLAFIGIVISSFVVFIYIFLNTPYTI